MILILACNIHHQNSVQFVDLEHRYSSSLLGAIQRCLSRPNLSKLNTPKFHCRQTDGTVCPVISTVSDGKYVLLIDNIIFTLKGHIFKISSIVFASLLPYLSLRLKRTSEPHTITLISTNVLNCLPYSLPNASVFRGFVQHLSNELCIVNGTLTPARSRLITSITSPLSSIAFR